MTQDQALREREIIILGGGCAGLSLAARLVQQSPDIALTVVEPRTRYEEDRTWCGWSLSPHFFSDCIVFQWSQWRIATPSSTQLLSTTAYPYEMIRASLVYEKARLLLNDSASSELPLGAEALTVYESADEVKVHLADGRVLSSPWVIDTRPQSRVLAPPWLWQNFVGFVIKLDGLGEGIDGLPTLMEFQSPGESVAQFTYTIPFGKRMMLRECTRFSKVVGEVHLLEAELAHWLTGALMTAGRCSAGSRDPCQWLRRFPPRSAASSTLVQEVEACVSPPVTPSTASSAGQMLAPNRSCVTVCPCPPREIACWT